MTTLIWFITNSFGLKCVCFNGKRELFEQKIEVSYVEENEVIELFQKKKNKICRRFCSGGYYRNQVDTQVYQNHITETYLL
jgi:hypothetical protein